MARIRSTFPGQWTDEEFVECQPLARLLILALRNEADDQGVFEWKPLGLKMRLMPADNVDVGELLAELEEHSHVKKFTANGKAYGAIRNFVKYQRPKKPTKLHPLPVELHAWVRMDLWGTTKKKAGSELDADQQDDGSEPDDGEGGTGSESTLPSKPQSSEPARVQPAAVPNSPALNDAEFRTGTEPVPQKGEMAAQREEGGGRKKEDLRKQPPPQTPPPVARSTDRASPAAVAVVDAFVAAKDARWPEHAEQIAPRMTLEALAQQHLDAGGTVELLTEVIQRGIRDWRNPTPPTSLAALRNSLTDRVAQHRRAVEGLQPPAGSAGNAPLRPFDPHEQVRARLRTFAQTGRWESFWGPEPGHRMCQIPKSVVLAEIPGFKPGWRPSAAADGVGGAA
jgi:hypothetical protein